MEVEERIKSLMTIVSMLVVTGIVGIFAALALIYWRYFDV